MTRDEDFAMKYKKWTKALANLELIHPPFLTADEHDSMETAEAIARTESVKHSNELV